MDGAVAVILALLGALCSIASIAATATASFRYLAARRFFRKDVATVQAKIVKKSSRRRFEVIPSLGLLPRVFTKHVCHYTFDTPATKDAKPFRVEAAVEVPASPWQQLEEGQMTQVRYQPDEVRLSQLQVVLNTDGRCRSGSYLLELCFAATLSIIGIVIGIVLPITTGNPLAVLLCTLPALWFASTVKRGGYLCCFGVCAYRTDPEESLCLCGLCERRSNGKTTRWRRDGSLWRSQGDLDDADHHLKQVSVEELKEDAAVGRPGLQHEEQHKHEHADAGEDRLRPEGEGADLRPRLHEGGAGGHEVPPGHAGAGNTGIEVSTAPRPKAKAKTKASKVVDRNVEPDLVGRSSASASASINV